MRAMFKKSMAFVMAFLLTLAMVTGNAAVFADSPNAGEEKKLEKNEKVASELDENGQTTITLSFPGKQEVLPSDIVFVLDKSGASAQQDIYEQAKAFLQEIKDQAEQKGLNVKVGVVLFNMVGNVKKDLTDIVTGYDDILAAMNSSVSTGTNMHAGLLAAKKLLDDDTSVQANHKHLVLISDGATYLYSKNGDYTKAYTRSFGDPKKQINPSTQQPYQNGGDKSGGIWEYQSREYNTPNGFKKFADGKNFTFSEAMQDPAKLAEYLAYYRTQDQDQGKNWPQYEYEYKGTGRKVTPIDVKAPSNIDIAFMNTDDTFQQMYKQGYQMNVYFKNAADFDGSVFLKYLVRDSHGGKLHTDFAELKKSVLDKIAKGSYVQDFMGKDFDFVNDIDKIKLAIGNEMLTPEKIDETTYGFGKRNDGSYRFRLQYVAGTEEHIVLTVNETVFPTLPVKLQYVEKLVTRPTRSGRYIYPANDKALLTPIDGNGTQGADLVFPVPMVTYTYQAPTVKVTFMNQKKLHAQVDVEKGLAIATDALLTQSMPADPAKTGFVFKEWNTQKDGKGSAFTDTTVVNDDITVYAIYTKQATGKGQPENGKDGPQTADTSAAVLYLALLGLSAGLLLAGLRRKTS